MSLKIFKDSILDPIAGQVKGVPWDKLVDHTVSVIIILVIAFIGSKIITRYSNWYAKRLDRKNSGDISDTGIIRLRARDTKHRVISASLRGVLYILLTVFAFHRLFPQEGSVLLGTTLALALIGFTLQPFVRDLVAGASMLAEEWFQVGDTIYIEPAEIRGVVEHINLRSTQLRTLAGEKVMIHNSSITSVSVDPRGIRQMKLEIFVRNIEQGKRLVKRVSAMLPSGPSQVINQLRKETVEELGFGGHKMWRIVCVASVAPGREWLLEEFAMRLFKEQDVMDDNILAHGPVVYNADPVGEKRAAQSILMN